MKNIILRPAAPESDFGQLAALFTLEQDEPTTESALKLDYEDSKERIISLMVAEDKKGELLGFNWATRNHVEAKQANFYVIVKPEWRWQGVGHRLYENLEQAARLTQLKRLQVNIRDTYPECRAFAERRGFSERKHQIAMALDLGAFDDRPYDEVIERLKGEGFQFTSMEALGNTQDAQHKLYILNDTAVLDQPGTHGEHSWISFEDFQKRVCQAPWYKPGGQMVVIDPATGTWAAMSAITRFEGSDHAYNLFTGVDRRYRDRKLAQAVKVLALRYARDVLKATTVHTNHNDGNQPMIAIDRKLGYRQAPGFFVMEKDLVLEQSSPLIPS